MADTWAKGSDVFEPPKYLGSLIAAVNDGAKAAQSGALAFALVGVYLLATAFSASDEDLLRGRAVTISQIGASLPVSFSFAIAPFVFVFLHFYSLARYDMLAANVRQFLVELQRTLVLEADRERCRQLLANVEFVQALVAPRASRLYSWLWRWLVRAVIAGFPVFVLLLVQINSLRYQSAWIMWIQRIWLAIDLLALVWFFYRNPLTGPEPWADTLRGVIQRWCDLLRPGSVLLRRFYVTGLPRAGPPAENAPASTWRFANLLWLPAAVMGLNVLYLNVVPASADPNLVRYDPQQLRQSELAVWQRGYLVNAFIFDNPLDLVACHALKWGCRYLRVDRRTLVDRVWDDKAIVDLWRGSSDEAKALTAIEGLVLRDRSLRFASLKRSSLFAADLTAADLTKADLSDSSLSGARLVAARLDGSELSNAQLQGADLSYSELRDADLRGAQLQGAYLILAHLPRQALPGAALQGAILTGAQLQGADLRGAQLQGADLRSAQLQGADLRSAQLQGTDLRLARLRGAIFGRAASLSVATFWPATDLSLSDLRGIDFTRPSQLENIRRLRAVDVIPGILPLHFNAAKRKSKDSLITSPTPAYTDALANLLVDQLASNDSAVAAGVAYRVRVGTVSPVMEGVVSDKDHLSYSRIGCRLITKAPLLDPQMKSLLSAQLKQMKVECELAQLSGGWD